MMRSLYSAVSGLRNHQTRMDVLGNNIANVNTIAFKSSAVRFQDVLYQKLSSASGATDNLGGVNAKNIGLGMGVAATTMAITTQGAAQTTGRGFDLRLTDSQTTNFFIVNNGAENLFTRAGAFYVDGLGNLCMDSTGYKVMGWQVDEETGDIRKDTVSPLQVMSDAQKTSAAEATSRAYLAGIVDRDSSDFSSQEGQILSLNFYDNLGFKYTARFSMRPVPATGEDGVEGMTTADGKDHYAYDLNLVSILHDTTDENGRTVSEDILGYDENARSWTVNPETYFPPVRVFFSTEDGSFEGLGHGQSRVVANSDTPAVEDQPTYVVSGQGGTTDGVSNAPIQIGTSGATPLYLSEWMLDIDNTPTTTTYDANGERSATEGAARETTLNDAFSGIRMDFSQLLISSNGGNTTAYMSSGVTNTDNTGAGRPLGTMTSMSVSNNGMIYGSYDNGTTRLLGQIATTQFENASGLQNVGSNCFTTTLNSGEFDGIGQEIDTDGSSMSSGELEMSNVDLSNEFTDMIVTQRGFQANSRMITTSDSILEELINLKR